MNTQPLTAGSGEDSGQEKSSEVTFHAMPSTATRGFTALEREMFSALKRVRTWLLFNGDIKDDGIWNQNFVLANNAVNAAMAAAKAEGLS